MMQRFGRELDLNLKSSRRRICLGTATRNRPMMLQSLLRSYSRLEIPENVELHFVIVENAERASLPSVIDGFRKMIPQHTAQYEIEPRLGIAFARNRILELALLAGCELLTFADDDEEVDSSWLRELLAERDREALDIVGSPVRISPLKSSSGARARLIWNGLDHANRKKERKALHRRSGGQSSKISIPTGSWMGRLMFFEETGLRFDEQYSVSGNEDGRLWLAAKKLGARTGWAPDAHAYETIPPERLSMRYQFIRSRDYTMTAFRAKFQSRPAATIMRIPGSMAARILSLVFCAVALPFTPGPSLVRISWNSGALVGILYGLMGGTSNHYRTVVGT